MKNDQWFEPGDKVMRVANSRPREVTFGSSGPSVGYGQVMNVEYCVHDPRDGFNWIGFTGINGEIYLAANFRKVDEIKLCVEAVKKVGIKEKEVA